MFAIVSIFCIMWMSFDHSVILAVSGVVVPFYMVWYSAASVFFGSPLLLGSAFFFVNRDNWRFIT